MGRAPRRSPPPTGGGTDRGMSSAAGRLLVIENEEGGRPAQLATAAERAGLALDVRSVPRGDHLPERLEDAAGLVILGATYDVRDAPYRPHLYREMELIRGAQAEDRPALGICLGGQLAAEALGGSVEPASGGPEIGWVTVRPTDEGSRDPVGSSVGDGTALFQWHHDVFTPPPGATAILTAERFPHQGFRAGSVWGVQSHPEVDADLLLEWCSSPGGAADLEAHGLRPQDLLEDAKRFSESARRVLDAWCNVVAGAGGLRPVVRRRRGQSDVR
jgi:GMP synthase (glutamine-hydrolysing)